MTDEVIINTLKKELDLDITLQDIEKTHQIGEPKKNQMKLTCHPPFPIIVKFFQCNDWNRVFRNKTKLKCQKIPTTESLAKIRMDTLRQAQETYAFTNGRTNDGKTLLTSFQR